MKKFLILTIFVLILSSNAYALSEEFQFMLEVMEIPLVSQNGYEINEEIYIKYNQLVYGNPLNIAEGQRWKDVEDGRWTKGGGMWKGTGIRGEYWVLGFDIYGNPIHNHKFPVDIEPPTPPTQWKFVPLSDALKSWTDTLKYQHEEQKIYMQTQKLNRNDITYDITALDIGLDKARAENYATWKTAGNIYTRRYDMNGKEWAANFIVPPMAADAKLDAILELPNGEEYVIKEDEEKIEIPVIFGAKAYDLSMYAKPEHIKIIKTELLLEDVKEDSVEDGKKTEVIKTSKIIIDRNDYPNCSRIDLEITAKSILLTEYTVDGALTDIERRVITIVFEGIGEIPKITVKDKNKVIDPEKPRPRINSIKLGRLSTDKNGNEKIIDLNIAKKTGTAFICAGQILVLEVETSNFVDYITLEFEGSASIVTLDKLTKRFEYDEPKSRNQKLRYSTLSKLENSYKTPIKILPSETTLDGESNFSHYYLIPYMTKQTLHSWDTLRELSKNAFEIDTEKLFSRISSPYTLKIKAYSYNGVVTESVKLDVFERWDTLFNRDISAYVR